MAQLTIRKLDDGLMQALRVRAAMAGRSTEAEVRLILAQAVASEDGRRAFVEQLLAIPVDSEEADAFPRSAALPREVEL